MPKNYAVLWELEGDESLQAGLAVEMDGYVLVEVPDHYGMPSSYRGRYDVLQPDSSRVTYGPGDAGYFEQVLIDLSRMFAIGEQGVVDVPDHLTVLDLLREKVIRPREQAKVGEYAGGVSQAGAPSPYRDLQESPEQESMLDEESTPVREQEIALAA